MVGDEFAEPLAIFARIAVDVANFRKFLTVCLADVEYICGAEPDSS